MNDLKYDLSKWDGILKGHTVFLVGNGPSLREINTLLIKDYFTIGINRAYLAIDPTILLWQDRGIYKNGGLEKIRKQKAIKICREGIDEHKEFNSFRIEKGRFSFQVKPDRLKGFGCSGILAAELAVAMGASSIVLLGFDAKYTDTTDFYGNNADHKDHTLGNFKRAYSYMKENCPIKIYNCSLCDLWKKEQIEDVIKEINPQKMTRIQWQSKLYIQ